MEPTKVILPQSIMQGKPLFIGLSFVEPVLFWVLHTPSVEAYAHALNGEYQLWTLKKRAGNAILPKTQIVDLREEFKKGNRSIFSEELHKR